MLFYLEQQGFIKLFYADESGFNLTPSIPYGWQEKDQYIRITPRKSHSVNVFGLLSKDNDFYAYTSQQGINSDLVIAFIDDFVKRITQRTVIILDNAPIHRSDAFENKIGEWEANDLYVFFLPKYSPHLNSIEILWRKIKYEWLKPHHYLNWETFREALDNILIRIGKEFTINFKE